MCFVMNVLLARKIRKRKWGRLLDPMNWICFAMLYMYFILYVAEDFIISVAMKVKNKKWKYTIAIGMFHCVCILF